MSVKINHTNIFVTLFISYVLLALLKVVLGIDAVFYLLIPIFGGLMLLPMCIKKKIFILPTILLLVTLLFGVTQYLARTSDTGGLFPLFMLCYLTLFVFFNKYYSSFNFLWVSNCCYLIYLFVAISSYFLLSNYYRSISSELIATRIFHGIEGTPASIDSFSTFIFLINFLYNKEKNRWLMYFLTLATIFTAGATTPVLVFLVVFLSYLFLRLFNSFSLLVFLFFVVMFGLFYLSYSNSLAHTVILIATNGRNIIWDLQIANLGLFNIVLGDVASSMVNIPWSSGTTINPHNAFLFIILRFGFIFFVLFVLLLVFKGKGRERNKQLLLMAFLAAGISNSNLFYIANPFYFYMICFCLSGSKNIQTGLLSCRTKSQPNAKVVFN
tara:strand:+ start:10524 stop:11672 length:1149 start_codon:yes stop_codon:yes gene_type:complete